MGGMTTKKPTYEELSERVFALEKAAINPQSELEKELAVANAKLKVEIEQRSVAEKALRTSEEKFRSIFENLTDVYFETTLSGKIITSSPSGAAFSGYSLDELIGNQVDMLYNNPEDRAGLLKELQKSGRVRGYEMLFRRKNGTIYNVSINADLFFDDEGNPQGMKGTIRDISDYKRANEMMIQTEKMKSVHGLATGMAHEINNPLAGILQNVQVMANRMKFGLPTNQQVAEECGISMEDIEAYLEKRGIFFMMESVSDAGKRAAKIVENILAFSRKGNSTFMYEDLGEVFDNALSLAENDYDLKKSFDYRRLKIIREYDESLHTVWCAPAKIRQVFLNIIKNSIFALSASAIKDPKIFFRVFLEKDRVRIEIEDNGPGNPKKGFIMYKMLFHWHLLFIFG